MKRSHVLILAILLLFQAPAIFAQDALTEFVNNFTETLQPDLESVFSGIGEEWLPAMQQTALSGNIVGDAEIGNFPHFTLSFVGVGANIVSGFGGFVFEPENFQNETLNIGDLASGQIEGQDFAGAVDLATDRAFPFPAVRTGLGLGLFGGYELLVSGFMIPDILLDFGKEQADVEQLDNAELGFDNLNVRLRKVILGKPKRRGRSLSIGVGYTYSGVNLGYTVNSLGDLTEDPVEVENLGYIELGHDLTDESDNNTAFNVSSSLHTVGMDIHMARRWPLVTTFFKISPYYQVARYKTSANVYGALVDPSFADPENPTMAEIQDAYTTDATSFKLEIDPDAISISDLSVYGQAGFELRLLGFITHVSAGLNLEDPIVDLGSAALSEVADGTLEGVEKFDGLFNGLTVNIGMRFQL